jgi:FixJ family two-component response regulator
VQYPDRLAIIDDDEELRLSLGGLMRAYSIEAQLFESAEAFLEADTSSFDCVIADVHMPGIDGISMIEHLRNRGSQIPVIIISALDPDITRDEAMASGALGYFAKPIDTPALLVLLAQLADSQRGSER